MRCDNIPVARLILCECGTVVRGRDEQELLRAARGHMETNHPAIAAQISDDELLALSHEDPSVLEQAQA
jgi:predicted small metal-binding protein